MPNGEEMRVLTKEEILNANDHKVEQIEIPEWRGVIGMRTLSGVDRDKFEAEIQRLLPALKQSGGFIFASDHSIPNSVSFQNMQAVVEFARKYGSYEH